MLWLCFKLPSCLFGNTRDTSVVHEKAKFVSFIYMKPQKMKFKSVQINMKRGLVDQLMPEHSKAIRGRFVCVDS